jgi:hypothetical protein
MPIAKINRSERFMLWLLRRAVINTALGAMLIAFGSLGVGIAGLLIPQMVRGGQLGEKWLSVAAMAPVAWTTAAATFGYFIVAMFLYLIVRVEVNLRHIAEGIDRTETTVSADEQFPPTKVLGL